MCLSLLFVMAFGYAFLVVRLVRSSHPVVGAVVEFENTYLTSRLSFDASLAIVAALLQVRFLSS